MFCKHIDHEKALWKKVVMVLSILSAMFIFSVFGPTQCTGGDTDPKWSEIQLSDAGCRFIDGIIPDWDRVLPRDKKYADFKWLHVNLSKDRLTSPDRRERINPFGHDPLENPTIIKVLKHGSLVFGRSRVNPDDLRAVIRRFPERIEIITLVK